MIVTYTYIYIYIYEALRSEAGVSEFHELGPMRQLKDPPYLLMLLRLINYMYV